MKKVYYMIGIAFLLNGCVLDPAYSIKEFTEAGVKYDSYEDLLHYRKRVSADKCVQKWRDKDILQEYDLSNKTFVYVAPVICGCFIHWKIDKKTKKVIGYSSEGEKCSQLGLVTMPEWYH